MVELGLEIEERILGVGVPVAWSEPQIADGVLDDDGVDGYNASPMDEMLRQQEVEAAALPSSMNQGL